MVLLQPDPFLNELTSMYERNREKGSVWVTLKRSCLRPKGKRKLEIDASEYKCLVRATDGQKTISTVEIMPCYILGQTTALALAVAAIANKLSAKDHLRFQASYATVLKAHMDALKKRERKDKKKVAEADKQKASSKAT